jgi:hypothetical protein
LATSSIRPAADNLDRLGRGRDYDARVIAQAEPEHQHEAQAFIDVPLCFMQAGE